MPSSMMSRTRILTILSLVALSTLSFTVVFGSHNIFDTLTRDTLAHDPRFSLDKSNIVHQRRALYHARATTAAPASESSSPQSVPIPSQSAPSTPDANTQASSIAPVSSPSPSSSAQPSATQGSSSSAPSPSRAASTSAALTSASASASASSTPSLSSSSSNTQASSSLRVTSSSVGISYNNPTTTFVNKPISFTSGLTSTRPTNAGSTVSSGPTPGVGATSGFFKNKTAVGATFSIIGIVGGLAAIMGVLTVMRRRRRTRYGRGDEDFFNKYPSVDHDFNEPTPHLPPGFESGSAEPSVVDINMSAAPVDAYPDRAVHYGQSNAGAILNPVDYGIAYPPGAANNNDFNKNSSAREDTESAYSVPSSSHPYADPVNSSGPSAAPPVTYPRPIPGRVQEMVTIDSYYGLNSAGVGAGGVGYAQ